MRNEKDDLGNRMKGFERYTAPVLNPQVPMIIRVDGKSFHTWTRGLDRPNRELFSCMMETAHGMVTLIAGAKLAFVQSDEISVLVTEDTPETQPWFGKKLQKVVSVSASLATALFTKEVMHCNDLVDRGMALFDSRAFLLPETEVVNYFVWRQLDAVRNSTQTEAQKQWSPKQLKGVSSYDLRKRLREEKGIDWSALPTWFKHGATVIRVPETVTNEMGSAVRQRVVQDWEAPNFCENPGYITSSFIR